MCADCCDNNIIRLEDDLIELFVHALPSKQMPSDAIARILINRLLSLDDCKQLELGYSTNGRQAVNGRIVDSLFSPALRKKTIVLLNAWNEAQQKYYVSITENLSKDKEAIPCTLIPIIEQYVSAYQKLLVGIEHLLSEEGGEDYFHGVAGASAMELILNYGCIPVEVKKNGETRSAYFLKPTIFAPQIMEAILRVCHDCVEHFQAIISKLSSTDDSVDLTDCFIDVVESIILALKNLDIRTFFNKRVYQFSPQYTSQVGLRYMGWLAGRQESHKEIAPIRLLEKIWYLIFESIINSSAKVECITLNVHLIGHVEHTQLEALSRLLYAICCNELQMLHESGITSKKIVKNAFALKLSKLKSFELVYTIHAFDNNSNTNSAEALQKICDYKNAVLSENIQIPQFSFGFCFGNAVNLKKVSDIRTLFEVDETIEKNANHMIHAYFVLDTPSIYSLAEENEKKSLDSVMSAFEDTKRYRYGQQISTITNDRNAKSNLQSLIHWLIDRCASPILRKNIYQCSADLAVLNRIRSVIASGKSNQKACYIFFTNNEALFSSELSDLNIARLELYNGFRTGVIRIANVSSNVNRLKCIEESDELEIAMNLWQVLKSVSSEICRYLCKFLGFDSYAKAVIEKLTLSTQNSMPLFSRENSEAALVYLFRSIYIRINYSQLCNQEFSQPLEVQLIVNKKLCDELLNVDGSDYSFELFLKKIEALSNGILALAFAPKFFYDLPLDQMKREVMSRAIYGRAQSVEDVMFYFLYVTNPKWLFGGVHSVVLGNTLIADCEDQDAMAVYRRMRTKYNQSSFQHIDKSFYAYRMITGDYGELTSLDRQLIRQVAEANDQWTSRKEKNASNELEEEQQVSLNIRRCCEEFGYMNTPLYKNYS